MRVQQERAEQERAEQERAERAEQVQDDEPEPAPGLERVLKRARDLGLDVELEREANAEEEAAEHVTSKIVRPVPPAASPSEPALGDAASAGQVPASAEHAWQPPTASSWQASTDRGAAGGGSAPWQREGSQVPFQTSTEQGEGGQEQREGRHHAAGRGGQGAPGEQPWEWKPSVIAGAENSPGGQPPAPQNQGNQGQAPQSPAAQSPAAQSQAAQNPAAQNQAAQHSAAQHSAAQGTAAQGTAAQNPAAQGTAAQNPAGQAPAPPVAAPQVPAGQGSGPQAAPAQPSAPSPAPLAGRPQGRLSGRPSRRDLGVELPQNPLFPQAPGQSRAPSMPQPPPGTAAAMPVAAMDTRWQSFATDHPVAADRVAAWHASDWRPTIAYDEPQGGQPPNGPQGGPRNLPGPQQGRPGGPGGRPPGALTRPPQPLPPGAGPIPPGAVPPGAGTIPPGGPGRFPPPPANPVPPGPWQRGVGQGGVGQGGPQGPQDGYQQQHGGQQPWAPPGGPQGGGQNRGGYPPPPPPPGRRGGPRPEDEGDRYRSQRR
ncbi:hypothetical protein [Actinosynnema sp.]|uniref:hypothetical protein n=1 Tax=Actinosynnema sp. TaxID=1872144 RepID=UPI003F8585DA